MQGVVDLEPPVGAASSPSGASRDEARGKRALPPRRYYKGKAPYVFLLPYLLLTAVFFVYPFLRAVALAFYQTNGPRSQVFVGLDNFLFLLQDTRFHSALTNTVGRAFFAARGVMVDDAGVVGAAQAAVTALQSSQTREDRLYIYQRLLTYARTHPDRQVVLKPRHRIGEDTFHRMKFHPEVLLSGVRRPPNFSIDYTPISHRLADLDLMLTVSSTAALEAVGAGVRTAFIADLDVREQLGNHIFLDSGLLRTFDQLERDDIGTPTRGWVEDYFFSTSGDTPAQRLADRALELVMRADRGRPPTWKTALFASQHELFTYRKQAAQGRPVGEERNGWARTVARWVLPYGIQVQLRQARARRQVLRQQAEEAQVASAVLDPSEPQLSQVG